MSAKTGKMSWVGLVIVMTLLFVVFVLLSAATAGALPTTDPLAQATPAAGPTPTLGPYGGGTAPTPVAGGVGISGQLQGAQPNYHGPYGFGRDASREEIAAWDIDIRFDGLGAPPGSGTVAQGASVYASKCAACHGAAGEGITGVPAAVAGAPLIKPFDPNASWPQFPRTIGNYWPFATTVFDYVRRSMPLNAPSSLTDDEVYAVTAWLLNKNGIIPDNATMNAQTLPQVKMPAQRFFRPVVLPDFTPD